VCVCVCVCVCVHLNSYSGVRSMQRTGLDRSKILILFSFSSSRILFRTNIQNYAKHTTFRQVNDVSDSDVNDNASTMVTMVRPTMMVTINKLCYKTSRSMVTPNDQ